MIGKFRVGYRFPLHFIPRPFARIEVYNDRVVAVYGSKRETQPVNASSRTSTSGSAIFGRSLVLDAMCYRKVGDSYEREFYESVYTYVQDFSEFCNVISRAIYDAKATKEGPYGSD